MEKFKTLICIRLILSPGDIKIIKKSVLLPFNPMLIPDDRYIIVDGFQYDGSDPHNWSIARTDFEHVSYNPYTDSYRILGVTFFESEALRAQHIANLTQRDWSLNLLYSDDFYNFSDSHKKRGKSNGEI